MSFGAGPECTGQALGWYTGQGAAARIAPVRVQAVSMGLKKEAPMKAKQTVPSFKFYSAFSILRRH